MKRIAQEVRGRQGETKDAQSLDMQRPLTPQELCDTELFYPRIARIHEVKNHHRVYIFIIGQFLE